MKIILTCLLLASLANAKFSLLYLSVPTIPLPQLLAHVTQKSSLVVNKFNAMNNGVIEQIKQEIESKNKNTESLRNLSQADYLSNQEILFLITKINDLKGISVDAKNSTTGEVKINEK